MSANTIMQTQSCLHTHLPHVSTETNTCTYRQSCGHTHLQYVSRGKPLHIQTVLWTHSLAICQQRQTLAHTDSFVDTLTCNMSAEANPCTYRQFCGHIHLQYVSRGKPLHIQTVLWTHSLAICQQRQTLCTYRQSCGHTQLQHDIMAFAIIP